MGWDMGYNREADKQKLLEAKQNHEVAIAWREGGGGLVYRLWDVYVLFEVPQYGGEASYVETFREQHVDEMLDLAYSLN